MPGGAAWGRLGGTSPWSPPHSFGDELAWAVGVFVGSMPLRAVAGEVGRRLVVDRVGPAFGDRVHVVDGEAERIWVSQRVVDGLAADVARWLGAGDGPAVSVAGGGVAVRHAGCLTSALRSGDAPSSRPRPGVVAARGLRWRVGSEPVSVCAAEPVALLTELERDIQCVANPGRDARG